MRLNIRLFSTHLKSRSFYVTTPIFYVNAEPHIGHLYTAAVADAVQRFEKLIDPTCRVIFSTGTDEHGTKVQQAAAKHCRPLQEFCDSVSLQYKSLFQDAHVDFTDYIRTTEQRHETAVQHFWNKLEKKDLIYASRYSGWYCVNDEVFVMDSHLKEEVRDGKMVKVSAESGHPVEWTEEQNYMFRLSSMKSDLIYWLKQEGVVTPPKFQKILQDQLLATEYLPDISVSRPSNRVHWAVKVPDDPEQSIYVWLDALINYLTVAGYPDKELLASRHCWPADVQILGKDILKFHGLYWPAFLMAVGLQPPRRLLVHSHWTVDDHKMSKSLGNVVHPRHTPVGLEALRYFLLREATMHSDANYSEVKMVRILNAELGDTMGNLLSRCTGTTLNPRQEFPPLHPDELRHLRLSESGDRLISLVEKLSGVCEEYYLNYEFYKVADYAMSTLHATNAFFTSHKPWELRKSPETQPRLDAVLHLSLESLRVCATALQPLLPHTSARVLTRLLVASPQRSWQNLCPSWQRGLVSEPRTICTDEELLFQKVHLQAPKVQAPKAQAKR